METNPVVARIDDARREALVRRLVAGGELHVPAVIDAFRAVPRQSFVPRCWLDSAYGNYPLPIGAGQTISQPAVIATMTESLELRPTDRVLEIGTGSGYQTAILSLLAGAIYSVELLAQLGLAAEERLRGLGITNVHVRIGDGYAGWPEHAPYDRILVTAAPPRVPPALLAQLGDPGILVAPVGSSPFAQRLIRVRRSAGVLTEEFIEDVCFVPMVGADD
jgi:protein-L-isoaspartate(D-aspartate) O-methyltransferase